jgi:hypothetical protein
MIRSSEPAEMCDIFKGTVSRDFQPLVFFIKQSHLGPVIHALKPFRLRLRICVFIRQIRCLSGVNDTAKANTADSAMQTRYKIMRPLRPPLRCQWHRCGKLCYPIAITITHKRIVFGLSGVIDTAEAYISNSNIFENSKPYAKGF